MNYQGKALFRMDKPNKVQRISVQVIAGNAETVAILAELKVGDQVVVRDSGMLKTGDIVNRI